VQISGKAVVVGDDVDTDVIFPARYLAVLDRKDQARHLFEPMGAEFKARLAEADVLAAGWNLGCGSSREHAVTSMLGHGMRLVVAKSFARIFFRNAINIGLPVVECPALAEAIGDGAQVTVDLAAGSGRVAGSDAEHRFEPLPPALLEILTAGGLWARHHQRARAG
jgi:3-isopropylmalate/(R)-2-methylmalate dehydratase small subunit